MSTTRRVEVTWRQIGDYINSLLVAGGMDLSRQMRTYPKWEDGGITFVHEQDEDAEPTEEEVKRQEAEKIQSSVLKRPSYLENL